MFDIIYGSLSFIFGLLIGSFLNVCIYRIPKGESIAYPPSHCTSCGARLKFLDLFPVLSYVFLGGKCRYCGEKISSRYAIMEAFTALMFLGVFLKFGFTLDTIKYMILVSFFIVIGMIDLDTTDVYSVTTYSVIGIGVVLTAVYYFMGISINPYLFGALLGGGLIALIILLTHGMGWGDFEICLASGLYLGLYNSIVMLLASFIFGGVIGVILIITKRKTRKDYIPFGPYIVLGTFLAMLYGDKIILWYVSFLS